MSLLKNLKNLFIKNDNLSSRKNRSIPIGVAQKSKGKLSQNVGTTEASCPYCHEKLVKKPTRKIKCPHCGNDIYKRTRPFDKVDVLIKSDQIDQIEEEWSIVNGSHEFYLEEKARKTKREKRIRDDMVKRHGKEPTENDLEFRSLNEQAVEAAFAGNWGFSTSYRLQMAKNLEKRKSHEQSLRMYYHVCYLDINGPNNRGGTQSADLDEFPFFTPKSGILAPGVIKRMKKLIEKLQFNEEDCKQGFLEVCEPIFKGSPMVVPPEKAWVKLKSNLFDGE